MASARKSQLKYESVRNHAIKKTRNHKFQTYFLKVFHRLKILPLFFYKLHVLFIQLISLLFLVWFPLLNLKKPGYNLTHILKATRSFAVKTETGRKYFPRTDLTSIKLISNRYHNCVYKRLYCKVDALFRNSTFPLLFNTPLTIFSNCSRNCCLVELDDIALS